MQRNSTIRLKIWGSLLLASSLVSCGSPVSQPVSDPSTDLSSISSSKPSYPASSPVNSDKSFSIQPSDAPSPTSTSTSTLTSTSTSTLISATTPSPSLPDKQSMSVPSAVEVSNIPPTPTVEELPPENSFQPNSPSLAGIKLGDSDKNVVKLYGLPTETYPLPGETQTIEIWEYTGFSIGLNTNNKVVYVEITSSDINTGIKGLFSGMNGLEAAQLLEVENNEQTNVLAVEVTGGWFKLDLDSDTQKVLSIKLLDKEI
jgi:hypothetical protein